MAWTTAFDLNKCAIVFVTDGTYERIPHLGMGRVWLYFTLQILALNFSFNFYGTDDIPTFLKTPLPRVILYRCSDIL